MSLRRSIASALALGAVFAVLALATHGIAAGVSPNISALDAIGDPNTPTNQLKINADGSLNTGTNSPLSVTAAAVVAPGIGYVPGTDAGVVIGGTFATAAALSVTDTQVVNASVNNGGTTCGNGSGKTLTGTTGTGTKFQVSATASGNAIVSIQLISVAGDYTVNPTSLTAEPVTGDSCTGVTLTIVMGALKASVSTAGSYTELPANPVSLTSTAGVGTGATWTLTVLPLLPTINNNTDGVSDAQTVQMTGASAGVLTGGPISTLGYQSVDIDVQAMSATNVQAWVSFDNGITYRHVSCTTLNSTAFQPGQNFTGTGQWECPAGDHFEMQQTGAGASTVYALRKRYSANIGGGITIGTNLAAQVESPGDALSAVSGLAAVNQDEMFNGSTWDRRYYCNSSATVAVTAGNTTQIVALSASKIIHVCGFGVSISTTGTFSWTSGTGTNCGSNTAALTGTMNLVAGNLFAPFGNPEVFRTNSAYELCLTATTGNINGWVSYAQY